MIELLLISNTLAWAVICFYEHRIGKLETKLTDHEDLLHDLSLSDQSIVNHIRNVQKERRPVSEPSTWEH